MSQVYFGRKFLVSLIVLCVAGFWGWPTNRKVFRPVVQTKNGRLQGIETLTRGGRKVHEFRQIPFAKPPIADLRFEAPHPAEAWKGIRDASKPRPQCMQVNQITGSIEGSEDCLYLNVYTPANRKGLLPVMVYVHGGSFQSGSASLYNPAYLLDEDVILVTTNYRLAALGFLNTGDEFARGNQGLKDQNLALKWVQENIPDFGGDTKQVTLFGESSGSMSVGFHLLSPMSEGLFSRAIMQSGSPLGNSALNREPISQAKQFAKKFNCQETSSEELVSCLKKLDAYTLVEAHRETLPLLKEKSTLFIPSIEAVQDDQAFLLADPLKLLKSGKFHKVPLIAGVTKHEGLLTSSVITANKTNLQYANDNWELFSSITLDFDPKNTEVSRKIRQFYFPGVSNIASEFFLENYTNLFSDRKFFAPVHQFVQEYKKHATVHLYLYSYSAETSLGNILAASQSESVPPMVSILWDMSKRWLAKTFLGYKIPNFGVCHADELQLLFNWQVSPYISKNHDDYQMSKTLVRLWADFAKNKPLIFDNVVWNPSKSSSTVLQYLNIDTVPKLIDEPFTNRIKFWQNLNL